MSYLGEVVKVMKAPEEAPHLLGKEGIVVHADGGYLCVKIGDRFTHFRKADIEVSGQPGIASDEGH